MSDFEIIDNSNIEKYKYVLSLIDSDTLIQSFKAVDTLYYRHTLTEATILKALTDLLTVKVDGKPFNFFIRSVTSKDPNISSMLYRVRKLSDNDIDQLLYFEKMQCTTSLPFLSRMSDIWAKPAEMVTEWSRLNRPKQEILYLSNSPQIALKETKCVQDDVFMLLQYRFKRKPINVYQIHDFQNSTLFSEEENLKLHLIQRFLLSTFSKFIPDEENQYYKIPAVLYNHFIKHKDIEAFIYPPVSFCKWPGFNVGVEGERVHNVLEFAGGSIYVNLGPGQKELYQVMKKLDFDWKGDSYKFYTPKDGNCYDNRVSTSM